MGEAAEKIFRLRKLSSIMMLPQKTHSLTTEMDDMPARLELIGDRNPNFDVSIASGPDGPIFESAPI